MSGVMLELLGLKRGYWEISSMDTVYDHVFLDVRFWNSEFGSMYDGDIMVR